MAAQQYNIKATTAVCEACLHQVHRPCASGAIIHSSTFWMELLQCHKVCEIDGDEFHRLLVVALRETFVSLVLHIALETPLVDETEYLYWLTIF